MLITDNAPTHVITGVESEVEHGLRVFNLSHIKVEFLPPNITSHVQPLDQGIIASTKAHYRRQMVEWILDQANKAGNEDKCLKELTPCFYNMLLWLKQSWCVHATSATIKSCWQKSELLDTAEPVNSSDSATEALSAAMSALEQVAHVQNFMPDDGAFVSANEFINLAGEIENVHDHMSDEQIVQLLTQGADDQPVADSESDCEVCTTSAQQALFMTAEVERFITSHPETFMAGQVAAYEM
jgi:hypothetical protein